MDLVQRPRGAIMVEPKRTGWLAYAQALAADLTLTTPERPPSPSGEGPEFGEVRRSLAETRRATFEIRARLAEMRAENAAFRKEKT